MGEPNLTLLHHRPPLSRVCCLCCLMRGGTAERATTTATPTTSRRRCATRYPLLQGNPGPGLPTMILTASGRKSGVLRCVLGAMPQLAGPMGQALGHYIRPNSGGTGFSTEGVKWSEPVTQVMLLVNPHESAPASPHDA